MQAINMDVWKFLPDKFYKILHIFIHLLDTSRWDIYLVNTYHNRLATYNFM